MIQGLSSTHLHWLHGPALYNTYESYHTYVEVSTANQVSGLKCIVFFINCARLFKLCLNHLPGTLSSFL